MTTHGIAGLPPAQGLYDPAFEHDACGIGFVAHLRGERSHSIVRDGLAIVTNLSHRSAIGGDAETGDGAGILIQVPHILLRAECRALDIPLPDAETYGVGMCFLPIDEHDRAEAIAIVDSCATRNGWRVLGWRDVPIDDVHLGTDARRTRPHIAQFFVAQVGLSADAKENQKFERELYLLRRAIEACANAKERSPDAEKLLYIASLSSRTVVYKGLLRPEQLAHFYPDLLDERTRSGLALVHSRFATNTFPSWARAHPYRALCHNGEINTLRGNLNWSRVREEQMDSPRFGDSIRDVLPVIQPDQSDSASLDNMAEMLFHAGRPVAHAMAMLVPKAWENDPTMPPDRRAFYEFHASLMEPWDGPAAIAFTDGRSIGALVDRNGLRPSRWMVTEDDRVVVASEAGALPVAPDLVRAKGRLAPGKMMIVNTMTGRLLHDDELQSELAQLRPYGRWVAEQRVKLSDESAVPAPASALDQKTQLRLFGYTREEMSMILSPMAEKGEEPVGSMGNDTPLAVLSERPQLLYSYFRQLFAQVTNPAIDPIREKIVMSLALHLGATGNVLDETPEHARQLRLEHPVLDEAGMARIRGIRHPAFEIATLSTLFRVDAGPQGLGDAVSALCRDAAAAVRDGASLLILSDRGVSAELAPIPSLLAVAAVHHHLITQGCRSRASIVVESGDAREVSHVALLFAYGASAVHPYLALEACATLDADGKSHYIKAVEKGLFKILSKMGISTLQSYCGAQVWEAVGLAQSLVDRHFPGTASRIGGVELDAIADDVLRRHSAALESNDHLLDDAGEYHHRAFGERHNWNPKSIYTLQRATRENNAKTFKEFSDLVNNPASGDVTLRSLFEFAPQASFAVDDVEPASAIVKRFATGAMSFGSISKEAHETLAEAMNSIGGRSNTGEGGESPDRFGTLRNSAIKQVASARFGVTAGYIVNAKELQIKIAQGAKPGEGGQLPGHKVDAIIAKTRHSTPGVTLISPPPHHDIYSIEDLKQLIHDLRRVNPTAVISVKLVSEAGVGAVAAGVAKAGADLIVIAGDSGGTGASPLSSIKRAGVPWEIGLSEAHQTLILNGLRDKVRLQVDGQLKTGRDVVIGALLGADEFGFATAPLIVEGCIMMRKCHLNTCPVGIATQDPVLREKFTGKPEHVINYFFFVANEVRETLASLGARSLNEVVGRTDLLRRRTDCSPRAATLDLSKLLHMPRPVREHPKDAWTPSFVARDALATELVALATRALNGERIRAEFPIHPPDRAVGAEIAGEVGRKCGDAGLPDDSIVLRFTGSAGQSFGAFATPGLTLELEGEANDYVAKGLSGGRVIVHPPLNAKLLAVGTPIAGNAILYGATAGELYLGGAAGERFAVRNSGALAVVEGVGDHACEYMTGGTIIILGSVARNFAAGMSGGVVFVTDEEGEMRSRWPESVMELEPVAGTDAERLLKQALERHARFTKSRRAKQALANWPETARAFVRLIPVEYKNALERQRAQSGAPRYG